jgi:LPXTG-site transpeptidase (sortase) family protein
VLRPQDDSRLRLAPLDTRKRRQERRYAQRVKRHTATLIAVMLLLAGGACGSDPADDPLDELARKYRHSLHRGEVIGQLTFPRFDQTVPLSYGLDQATIDRGPGWFPGSYLPGEGSLIYIAGHRRTHGAPFLRIGDLRPGDGVRFTTPYAVATYAVIRHELVSERKLSVLHSDGREEELRLQASTIPPGHKRLLVFARLKRIAPTR